MGSSTASNGSMRAARLSSKTPTSTQRPSRSVSASSKRASGSTSQ
jgi:hypothetical protein